MNADEYRHVTIELVVKHSSIAEALQQDVRNLLAKYEDDYGNQCVPHKITVSKTLLAGTDPRTGRILLTI